MKKKKQAPLPLSAKLRRAHIVRVEYKSIVSVTDAQLSKIATTLGVQKSNESVNRVIAIIRRAAGRDLAMAALPNGDHHSRDIKTLTALARAMDGLNTNVLARLSRHGVDFTDCNPLHVAEIARLAANEIQKPTPKRGRKANVSRNALYADLATIYKSATNRKAIISHDRMTGDPAGPFFKFMCAALEPVPRFRPRSDEGFASAVKSATRRKG